MTKYCRRVVSFLYADSSASPPLFVRGDQFLHTLFRGNDEVLFDDYCLFRCRYFRDPTVIVRGVRFLHTLFRGNDEVLFGGCCLSCHQYFGASAVVTRAIRFLHTFLRRKDERELSDQFFCALFCAVAGAGANDLIAEEPPGLMASICRRADFCPSSGRRRNRNVANGHANRDNETIAPGRAHGRRRQRLRDAPSRPPKPPPPANGGGAETSFDRI